MVSRQSFEDQVRRRRLYLILDFSHFVEVHPDTGVPQGTIRLETKYGTIKATVKHNDNIRKEVIRAPAIRIPDIMKILPDEFADFTGAPILDGIACQIHRL